MKYDCFKRLKLLPFICMLFGMFPLSLKMEAQNLSQSPFGRYTLGDQLPNPSSWVQALGGNLVAFSDSSLLNLDQPASLASLGRGVSIFEGSFTGEIKDYTLPASSARGVNAGYSSLALAFPILRKYWITSVHLMPITNMGYTLRDSTETTGEGQVLFDYNGSGGISALGSSHGIRLGNSLALGFEFRYLFGKTQYSSETYFPDQISLVRGSRILGNNRISGFDSKAGITFQHCFKTRKTHWSSDTTKIRRSARVQKDSLQLKIGFSYRPLAHISGSSTYLAESFFGTSNLNTIVDTVLLRNSDNGKVVMPSQIAAGFSLASSSNKWLFTASWRYTDWSGFSVFGAPDSVKIQNVYSAGLQWTPNPNVRRGLFKKAQYRIGGYYSDGYLSLRGQAVEETAITFGMGLPFDLPTYYRKPVRSMVNFAVTAGQRGNVSTTLLQERFVRLSISFTLSDRWFIRTRFE
jgi:hypothetical protein